MPQTSEQIISHPVLANQVMSINGGGRLAQEGLMKVLNTSHSHFQHLGIEFIRADNRTDQVTFNACRGLPPSQLIQVADGLSKWFENRIAELLPKRHARQLAKAI